MPETNLTGPQKRYSAYTGFVTTPRYFDDSVQMFLEVAPKGVAAMQRVNDIPDYKYELGQRASNFNVLEESAICLGQCFCTVIGQAGTNWVHCNGTTPDEIETICDQISEKANARFLMAGHCIVMALRELGAKKITVANGYYREDWKNGINRYLEQAGFEVLYGGNVIDQGLYPNLEAQIELEDKTHWDYPNEDVVKACLMAHEAAPEADAVVQTGSGFRVTSHMEQIEGITGKPLVPSDTSLFWAMLKELDLGVPIRGHGHLLGTL